MDEQHTRFRIAALGTGTVDWQVRGPGLSEDISATWVGDPTVDPMLRAAVTMLTFKEAWFFWQPSTPDWSDIHLFADDLLTDCAALLREWGRVGYHEMWQNSEFPMAMLLRLMEVRRGGEPNKMGLGHELADLNRIGAGLLP